MKSDECEEISLVRKGVLSTLELFAEKMDGAGNEGA